MNSDTVPQDEVIKEATSERKASMLECKDDLLEKLKQTRDHYYDGDWEKLLRDYKIRLGQNPPKQLADTLRADIKLVETRLGRNPEQGHRDYFNMKFRLPKGTSSKDFKELIKINCDHMPPLAIVACNEMAYMLGRIEERQGLQNSNNVK